MGSGASSYSSEDKMLIVKQVEVKLLYSVYSVMNTRINIKNWIVIVRIFQKLKYLKSFSSKLLENQQYSSNERYQGISYRRESFIRY